MKKVYLRMDNMEAKQLINIIDRLNITAEEKDAALSAFANTTESGIRAFVSVPERAVDAFLEEVRNNQDISDTAKLFLDGRKVRFCIARDDFDRFFAEIETKADKNIAAIHKELLENADRNANESALDAGAGSASAHMMCLAVLPDSYIRTAKDCILGGNYDDISKQYALKF